MTNKLAAAWTAGYATIALGWTITGRGFPFGPHDPGRDGSPLRDLDPSIGAPLFAVVLGVTALLVLVGRGLGWTWLVAAVLLLVVPDVRLLTFAGYLPILIVGFPFGFPPDYGTLLNWTLLYQAIGVVAGVLLARAALRRQFRTAGACEACGRPVLRRPGRWGVRATYVAVAVPVFYAVIRLAWAAGYPLGIPEEFLREMQRTGMVWAGAGLGAFALVGAVLTLGLVQRWGEVFPRWMIGLAGKRVPIRLATIPAGLVAVFVGSASVAFLTDPDGLRAMFSHTSLAEAPWATWPLWSVALAAATVAYHLRRRPACENCGRSDEPVGVVPTPRTGAY
jgi:hypothetical protein